MTNVLEGVRVLEVASWTFVPAAGAILADWGADVLKIEHPVTGDPQRGLISSGLIAGAGGVNHMVEFPNRGKRSVGLDLAHPDGLELLHKLAESSDVFLTNFLPKARQRLRIDIEHIRERNPDIIYVRGSGQGVRGPEAERGGYDSASYWSRGGIADMLTSPDAQFPTAQRPAFGDVMGGMALTTGICAALYKRATTGVTSLIDVSLLGTAVWNLMPDITAAGLFGEAPLPRFDWDDIPNPIVNMYRTSDGRFLNLVMLESDRFWPEVCERVGHPEWATDPRFVDAAARFENHREAIQLLRGAFAERTLAEWKEILADAKGVWAVVQTPHEVHQDPQVIANGYLRDVETGSGGTFRLPANPIQFDETPPDLTRAPEHGEHTEAVLLEMGVDWDQIIAYKESGAIL
jgi:crotonobetainyl-CoA:carnitine CoA-transferase CaiB-like acyl-CoA transferase